MHRPATAKKPLNRSENDALPLVVDLDGTLIKSDTLIEAIVLLIRKNPRFIFFLPLWLLKGKASFKAQIANHVELDASALPYRNELVEQLNQQKNVGRVLVLATAANSRYAHAVANHLGLFDAVFGSDTDTNLSGKTKQALLTRIYGEKGFDYIGDSHKDLPVWEFSNRAIVVNGGPSLRDRAAAATDVERTIDDQTLKLATYLKAFRPHQWVKNLLVFVPLIASHQVFVATSFLSSILAFVAFSLCASSVYLLNDMLDLPDDRRHRTKKLRPIAQGQIPLPHVLALIPTLVSASFIVCLLLPGYFALALGLYYVTTVAYSVYLKRRVVVDTLSLASLYTLRVIAGAAAIGSALSFWLLAFSMFLFLSLALVKRYTELIYLQNVKANQAAGRAYLVDDLQMLSSLGAASGYLSVLVLALYINSPEVHKLYSQAEIIWLVCPLLLYWISRTWLIAHRGQMHDDPIVFAVTDRTSRITALCILVIVALAI